MNNNNSDNPPPLPPSPPPPSPPLPPPPSPPPLLTNTPHPCIPTSSRAESFDEGSRSLVLGHIGGGSDGENPKKKKRSKLTRITTEVGSSSSSPNSNNIVHPKPKPTAKKPEPNAPNITRPCTECGKQFWSWKALFGHMRCHPERQWRGINPPPNLRKPVPALDQGVVGEVRSMNNISDEDQEVVTSLLMLANGLVSRDLNQPFRFNIGGGGSPEGLDYTTGQAVQDQPLGGLGFGDGAMLMGSSSSSYRFECSSCKKVFGSHQALGGHRASHKNVKGCFAIARNDDEPNCSNIIDLNLVPAGSGEGNNGERDGKMVMDIGHKCGICFRVFSSGQALGGHMRCHWEKDEHEPLLIQQGQGLLLGPTRTSRIGGVFLDLNLPPPSSETHHGDENSSSSSSSSTSTSSSSKVLGLDLRLGFP